MRILEIRDQLQDLGEIMFDKEMTTVVLNTLLEEWATSLKVLWEERSDHFPRSMVIMQD